MFDDIVKEKPKSRLSGCTCGALLGEPCKGPVHGGKITNSPSGSSTSSSRGGTSQSGSSSYITHTDKVILSIVELFNVYEKKGLILHAPFYLMKFEKEAIKDFEATKEEKEWALNFLFDIGYKITYLEV